MRMKSTDLVQCFNSISPSMKSSFSKKMVMVIFSISLFMWISDISAQTLTFTKYQGSANDIGISSDGRVWVVGTDRVNGGFGIFTLQSGTTWDRVKGGAVRISVDPHNHPWVVNDKNEIYRSVGSNFEKLPGSAHDIGIGADGTAWVIGTNPVNGGFGIYKWNGKDWDSVKGGAVRISVDPNGNPWIVNDKHEIYRYSKSGSLGGFEKLPGSALDIGVGPEGTVYVVGTNPVNGGFGIYRWNGKDWDPLNVGAILISVDHSGNPWVVDDRHEIYGGFGDWKVETTADLKALDWCFEIYDSGYIQFFHSIKNVSKNNFFSRNNGIIVSSLSTSNTSYDHKISLPVPLSIGAGMYVKVAGQKLLWSPKNKYFNVMDWILKHPDDISIDNNNNEDLHSPFLGSKFKDPNSAISWHSCSSDPLPPGSYQQTCNDFTVESDTLAATCRARNGSMKRTQLAEYSRCTGDISNNDGNLTCPR